MLTISQTINHGEQCRKDALAWHDSSGKHSPENLRDFEAGFKDGWSQCIRNLTLHGYQFPDPR